MSGYRLERQRVRAGFDRAAARYDDYAVLQTRVREQLLERLDYVRIEPAVVVDLGAGTGRALQSLGARYPGARVVALDSSLQMLARGGGARVLADARELPLAGGAAGLIFSNLMLQCCDDLDAALAEIRRVMAPHGLFTFTALGPDTLAQLRSAWREVDPRPHLHGFFDMHDVGDALVRAGLVEPVMDVERYTLTYCDVPALLRDLRRSGSVNALPQRSRGLMGREAIRRLSDAYERYRVDERLPATVEVVFGQAWCPAGRGGATAHGGVARIDPGAITRRGG